MYASGINTRKRKALKTAFAYLLFTLFCLAFGFIYEAFSYGVYSKYMIYAFAFPLIGGTLPYMLLAMSRTKWYPIAVSRNLHHAGIVTLTVGSIANGVLEIYGTTNSLTGIYWIAGIIMIVSAMAALLPFGRLQECAGDHE